MTNEEIKEIIEKHKHWFNEDCEGWENMKANLRGANLCDANLCDANLRGADHNFKYTVGEIVEEPKFDDNRWNECAPGIHCFITRNEAVNY